MNGSGWDRDPNLPFVIVVYADKLGTMFLAKHKPNHVHEQFTDDIDDAFEIYTPELATKFADSIREKLYSLGYTQTVVMANHKNRYAYG